MLRLTIAAWLLFSAAGAAQPGLVEDGQVLFLRGARPGAPPPRATAASGTVLPATAMPCGNCHGADGGGGRMESGVRPPSILWSALTQAAPGRRAYSDSSVLRAIAQGIGPDGRALDPIMPRYDLTLEDGQALLAYLRALGTVSVPGIEEHLVRIGVVVPQGGMGDAFAAALQEALAAAAPEGVFGRRVSVLRANLPEQRDAAEEVSRLLDAGVLALVSALPGEANDAVVEAAARDRVPVLSMRAGLAASPEGFALLPGVVDEAVALLRRLREPGRALILIGGRPSEQRLAEAIVERVGSQAEADPRVVTPGELPGAVPEATGILLLLPPQQIRLVSEALRLKDVPLLIPGSVGGEGIRAAATAAGRPVLVGLGIPPSGGEGTAGARFAAGQAARAGLAGRLGHAAGEVMVEALRRSGRRVTRERLVAAFSAPDAFETGALPPQRLLGNARSGAGEIAVLRIHGDGRPAEWAGPVAAE
ncbi:hypothetical protein J8J14_07120 [Roseomonas sp. SSH11]|uniref:Cytochrome c domain-containing protein n=1 Tax=Pararoseomonas baculiformis TaxID=2820812 RepID=A0ABS4ADC9_9PROT|nr:hypothetical protein [Pararoseomonas baculiformis]MBP0444550.1 hypothetical protein [Pararoseomonas baculiformis]